MQPRHRDDRVRLQARGLVGEALLARGRKPVVTTQPAIHDLLAVYLDQSVHAKPVQSRVQGSGTQSDTPVGDLLDVSDDPVTMLAATRDV